MKIPFVDLKTQCYSIKDKIDQVILSVIQDSDFIGGRFVMKISYVNEIANLCEKIGADIQAVISAMGKDGRISPKFLHCGPGYGGSCFPKDTKALAKIGRENNSPITLIESTIKSNQNQKLKMVEKIEKDNGKC